MATLRVTGLISYYHIHSLNSDVPNGLERASKVISISDGLLKRYEAAANWQRGFSKARLSCFPN
ncbi:hypothetical protein M408DRAFT_327994, partial [Serendipita vermifera MAFF 305830]